MKHKLNLIFIFISVLLLTLLTSACSQNEQINTENENSITMDNTKQDKIQDSKNINAEDSTKTTNKVSDNGFDFSYKDLDDNIVKLSDYRGKWVIVNFWATWCPPCRKEIPDFVKFKTMYADQVEILGIDNEDADIEIVRAFAEDYQVNYPILIADVYNPTEFDKQNTMGLPTTVIFNPQGEEVSKRVGPMHFDDLVKVVGIIPSSTDSTATE